MINALLIRWSGGWAEIRDDDAIAADGRHEALLGLGAVQSLAELERVARRQLAIYLDPRTEISAGLAPHTADIPYQAFRVGDALLVPDRDGTPTRERVMALTVAEDENGTITYAPEFKDVLLNQAERWEQALKKMSDGTVRGDSKVATPAGQIRNGLNTAKDCCPPTPAAPDTFAISTDSGGGITDTTSGASALYLATAPATVTRFEWLPDPGWLGPAALRLYYTAPAGGDTMVAELTTSDLAADLSFAVADGGRLRFRWGSGEILSFWGASATLFGFGADEHLAWEA